MFYFSTVFIHIFAIRFTHRRPCSRENSVRWTVGSYLLCLMFFSLERKHSHYKEDGNSLRKISNFVHQEPMTPIDACTSETATLTSVLGIQASWLAAEPEAKPLFDYLLIIFLLFLFLSKEYKFFIIHCSVIIIFVTIIIIYFQISNVLLKWLSLSLHF